MLQYRPFASALADADDAASPAVVAGACASYSLRSMHVVATGAVQCGICVQIAVACQQLDSVRAHRGFSNLPSARMHNASLLYQVLMMSAHASGAPGRQLQVTIAAHYICTGACVPFVSKSSHQQPLDISLNYDLCMCPEK